MSHFRSRWLIIVGTLLLLALALLAPFPHAPEAILPTPPATLQPTSTPSPTPAPTPTPRPDIQVSASASPLTITFQLHGQLPSGNHEALLWYDTAAGHGIRRVPLAGAAMITASVTITPSQEGLTLTVPLDSAAPTLDYWWAVRNDAIALRRNDTLVLPDSLAALASAAPLTAPTQLVWEEQATPHFRLLAPPGTAATRDLDRLAAIAEAGFAQAAMVITPTRPVSVPVYLTPRVFWQGGVAYGANGLIISYLDRNYAGVETWTYFVHEVTHALSALALPPEAEVGGLFGEGAAVYATGGHYSRAPIDMWAAALAASDRYVPLCQLRYDFYSAQHEVAYLEGASFVEHLIRTYGLETFMRIYATQPHAPDVRQQDVETFCEVENRRVIAPTGKTLGALEQNWLAYLKTLRPSEQQRRAWELTVRFFDTMRRYQERFDPPARDLPPPPPNWDRITAAKYLHAATGRRATVLETMLATAGPAIARGDIEHGERLLDAIERALETPNAPPDPLTRDYDAIAALVERQARALRIGDRAALDRTLASPALADRLPVTVADLLHDLRFTLVALDVRGNTADGAISVTGAGIDGQQIDQSLYRVRFTRQGSGWLMAGWVGSAPVIEPPPERADILDANPVRVC